MLKILLDNSVLCRMYVIQMNSLKYLFFKTKNVELM